MMPQSKQVQFYCNKIRSLQHATCFGPKSLLLGSDVKI